MRSFRCCPGAHGASGAPVRSRNQAAAWLLSGIFFVALATNAQVADPPQATSGVHEIKIKSRASLLHLGSLDSFDRTPEGTRAAKLLLQSVTDKDPKASAEAAREAIKIYESIIPGENFGGEYTALKWLCEYQAGTAEVRTAMLAKKYADSPYTGEMFYRVWAEKDFTALKEYIRFKYKIDDAKLPDDRDAHDAHRWREDFVLFNNPRREDWERTSQFIEKLQLKPGNKVIDIGCGPGYFAFKFSQIVGPKGKVYAVDNNPTHIEYMNKIIKELKITNIQMGESQPGEIGVPEDAKEIDCVYLCSLWHVLYGFTHKEKVDFIEKLKTSLKPDGKLVIVDNAMIHPNDDPNAKKLAYHGPYIDKELIIAQMKHFGFKVAGDHQIIPQRYMLIFQNDGKITPPSKGPPQFDPNQGIIRVDSPTSLVGHLKVAITELYTKDARMGAREMYDALKDNNRAKAEAALARFKKLAKEEEIGNEYTAFIWFCEYFLADEAGKKKLLDADFLNADYLEYLGGNDFALLKRYLWNRYMLFISDKEYEASLPEKKKTDAPGFFSNMVSELKRKNDPAPKPQKPEVTGDVLSEWHERIAFNNPYREHWERSSEILKAVKLKPGEDVADIGCGHGFYTFKFAKAVGTGKVFALETNDDTMKLFKTVLRKHPEVKNVFPSKSTYDNCGLPPNSVDVMFMCSVYDAVYTTSIDFVRDRFIESLKTALRDNGRIIIVDNEVFVGDHPPYYGPRIDRRLIVEQLRHYGFKLVDSSQPCPQRYLLVFQKDLPKKP